MEILNLCSQEKVYLCPTEVIYKSIHSRFINRRMDTLGYIYIMKYYTENKKNKLTMSTHDDMLRKRRHTQKFLLGMTPFIWCSKQEKLIDGGRSENSGFLSERLGGWTRETSGMLGGFWILIQVLVIHMCYGLNCISPNSNVETLIPVWLLEIGPLWRWLRLHRSERGEGHWSIRISVPMRRDTKGKAELLIDTKSCPNASELGKYRGDRRHDEMWP